MAHIIYIMIHLDKRINGSQEIYLSLNENSNYSPYVITFTNQASLAKVSFNLTNDISLFPERINKYLLSNEQVNSLENGLHWYSVIDSIDNEIETGLALVVSVPSTDFIEYNNDQDEGYIIYKS